MPPMFGIQKLLNDLRLPLLHAPVKQFRSFFQSLKRIFQSSRHPLSHWLLLKHQLMTFVPCAPTLHNFQSVQHVRVVLKLFLPPKTSVSSYQKLLSKRKVSLTVGLLSKLYLLASTLDVHPWSARSLRSYRCALSRFLDYRYCCLDSTRHER